MFHITLRLDKLVCSVRRQAEQRPSLPDRLNHGRVRDAKYALSPAPVWFSSLEERLLSGLASPRRMLAQPSSEAPQAQTTDRKVREPQLE